MKEIEVKIPLLKTIEWDIKTGRAPKKDQFIDGDTAKRVINKGWIPGGWYQRIPWSVLQKVCDP